MSVGAVGERIASPSCSAREGDAEVHVVPFDGAVVAGAVSRPGCAGAGFAARGSSSRSDRC